MEWRLQVCLTQHNCQQHSQIINKQIKTPLVHNYLPRCSYSMTCSFKGVLHPKPKINICDVIKQNESEFTNNVFKIQPNKTNNFFCFWLFVQSFSCSYLWNQLPSLSGVFTKLKPKQLYPNRKCQKNNNHIFLTSDSFCLIASHFLCSISKFSIHFGKQYMHLIINCPRNS